MANEYDKSVKFYKPFKRFVLPIENFHVPKKLFYEFKKKKYIYKINSCFEEVINSCQKAERGDKGTWINDIILNTYIELFKSKKCHSVECYEDNNLIGGLYGVHLGSCFFGESMFNKKTNASKFSLLYLISILKKNSFTLLDSQFYNKHLVQFGGYEITDNKYMKKLNLSLKKKSLFIEINNFQEVLSLVQSTNHKS